MVFIALTTSLFSTLSTNSSIMSTTYLLNTTFTTFRVPSVYVVSASSINVLSSLYKVTGTYSFVITPPTRLLSITCAKVQVNKMPFFTSLQEEAYGHPCFVHSSCISFRSASANCSTSSSSPITISSSTLLHNSTFLQIHSNITSGLSSFPFPILISMRSSPTISTANTLYPTLSPHSTRDTDSFCSLSNGICTLSL